MTLPALFTVRPFNSDRSALTSSGTSSSGSLYRSAWPTTLPRLSRTSPSSSTARPTSFFGSPSTSLPTRLPFSSSTQPSLTTIRPSRPANSASVSSPSSRGNVLARPITWPLVSQNWPWLSQVVPSLASFFGSPSTSSPTGLPDASTILPALLHRRPSRVERGGNSSPTSTPDPSSGTAPSASCVINSTLPITLPFLSSTSPLSFSFLPATADSSPS